MPRGAQIAPGIVPEAVRSSGSRMSTKTTSSSAISEASSSTDRFWMRCFAAETMAAAVWGSIVHSLGWSWLEFAFDTSWRSVPESVVVSIGRTYLLWPWGWPILGLAGTLDLEASLGVRCRAGGGGGSD